MTSPSSPPAPFPLEFGLDTFGDVTVGPDGAPLSHGQVLRNVVAEGEAADAAGVDVFGVGEHHRADFAVSAPEVLLAAIAARTSRIRLGSAVTVLSSDDPVRVFQRFATLDGLSAGRAEVIVGRGSFTESFPLFGYPLDQYHQLFEEKLDLFVRLREGGPVTWRGTGRASLERQDVFPTLDAPPLRTWVGVGGSPESVVRAARHGLPLILAIIGGNPRRFSPYVTLFHRALAQQGREPLPVGVHSPGFVAATDDRARELFWPPFRAMMTRIGAERGWPPFSRDQYEAEIAHGSLYVGAPETVARRIAETIRALGVARFSLKYSAGTLAHEHLLECVTRYGREVVPQVRALLAGAPARSDHPGFRPRPVTT
jgi:probable LLM family oxidoreductase